MAGTRGAGLAVLLLLSFFDIKSTHADSIISLASVGTAVDSGQTNVNGATIAIAPNVAWASALPGSSWVSFSSTGDTSAAGFVAVPNGTVVTFFDVFNIPGIATGGSLTVMADDSATILLNGVILTTEATSTGNTYSTCSDFGIGCILPMAINLPASLFQAGLNTLEFEVAQRNGSSFGLDYSASVIDPVEISEPGAGLMLGFGFGLLILSVAVYRHKQSRI